MYKINTSNFCCSLSKKKNLQQRLKSIISLAVVFPLFCNPSFGSTRAESVTNVRTLCHSHLLLFNRMNNTGPGLRLHRPNILLPSFSNWAPARIVPQVSWNLLHSGQIIRPGPGYLSVRDWMTLRYADLEDEGKLKERLKNNWREWYGWEENLTVTKQLVSSMLKDSLQLKLPLHFKSLGTYTFIQLGWI